MTDEEWDRYIEIYDRAEARLKADGAAKAKGSSKED